MRLLVGRPKPFLTQSTQSLYLRWNPSRAQSWVCLSGSWASRALGLVDGHHGTPGESTEHPSAPGAASCCLGCCHGPESAQILWSDLKMMKAFGALHNWSVEIWIRLYFFIACVKTIYGWIKWSYIQFFFKIMNNTKLPWQCKPREDVDANACAVKWALFRSCTNLLMPETLHRKLQAFKGFWNVSDTNCLPADVSVAVGV